MMLMVELLRYLRACLRACLIAPVVLAALFSAPAAVQAAEEWDPWWAGSLWFSSYPSWQSKEYVENIWPYAKSAYGSTPLEACFNEYVQSKAMYGLSASPLETKYFPDGRACGYNESVYGYWTNAFGTDGLFSLDPVCKDRPFAILEREVVWGTPGASEKMGTLVRSLPRYMREYYQANGGLPISALEDGGYYGKCQCAIGSKRINYSGFQICTQMPEIVIGFFNGVANTRDEAQEGMKRLKVEFSDKYKDVPLKYDLFYNQTACGSAWFGAASCLEDVAETFAQRSQELGGVFANRWEIFWDILAGRHQAEDSWAGRLSSLLTKGRDAFAQWLDATHNAAMNQLASSVLKLLTLFGSSPTYENRADHLARLTGYADRGSGLVLVAHSQGNLFVNSAYDALLAGKPNAQAKVVHVAPASPTLRGEHILADIDVIINGLRVTGVNTVQPINIFLPTSKRDITGHFFEETYLDTARAAYARTKELITNSLQALAP